MTSTGVSLAIVRFLSLGTLTIFGALGVGCSESKAKNTPASSASFVSSSSPPPTVDEAFETCKARYSRTLSEPAAPGAKSYDDQRSAFLGRVRGEPALFVRAPAPSSDWQSSKVAMVAKAAFDKEPPGLRILKLKDRLKHEKPALRSLVLREGYFYADDPDDLFETIERISLTDLFDQHSLSLLRRGETFHLVRGGTERDPSYAFDDGPYKGRSVQLVFGDRVATDDAGLASPLSRDVASLSDREGFERMHIDRLTEKDIAATLRYGDVEAKAVLEAHGASLDIACLAEPKETRDRALLHAHATESRRNAIRALRDTVTEVTFEALPFDRPRGFKGPDRDGELRPYWLGAYLAGQTSFKHDDEIYSVYRADGRPNPPEVCVDFVLESLERTSGNWFAKLGEKPHREKGRLSFDDFHSQRPRGVVALGTFAEANPELFEMRRMGAGERVPFGDRKRFFAFLEEHADWFAAGDILSIQGMKRDDRVHQHAILLEAIDPISGFPYGLADQMRLPRRRSWEGIMAEAPKRSLYYRIHPKEALFTQIAPVDPSLAQSPR